MSDKDYSTSRRAVAAATRMKLENYIVIRSDKYFEGDHMVPVTNLMSGSEILIRRSELGTCCDPSTERYWSM